MSEKYEVVEITFINENGERITCNLETGTVIPENLNCKRKAKAMLYTGMFVGGGNNTLNRLLGEA